MAYFGFCCMEWHLKAGLELNQSSALDELLGAYSAGGLAAPLQALVESHLLLSQRNRSYVRDLETLAAHEALSSHLSPLSNRDSALSAIFGSNYNPEPKASNDQFMPKPLYDFVGYGLKDLNWKHLLPGIKEAIVSSYEEGEVSFLWVKAGGSMPVHTHEGSEYTLVLKGSFSDASGRYGVGDIAIADDAINHRPMISRDEDCICFTVTDAPLRLTGTIGKFLNPFVSKKH